jgi:hypothetical protein
MQLGPGASAGIRKINECSSLADDKYGLSAFKINTSTRVIAIGASTDMKRLLNLFLKNFLVIAHVY